ncbi:hypothetical protein ACMX2M_20440 [Paenibacillus polymyxa]
MIRKKFLISGGYGAEGAQIARILHDRHPDPEFVLGGRSAGKQHLFYPTVSTRLAWIRMQTIH